MSIEFNSKEFDPERVACILVTNALNSRVFQINFF